MPFVEIAQRLGVREGAARVRAHRAYRALSRLLFSQPKRRCEVTVQRRDDVAGDSEARSPTIAAIQRQLDAELAQRRTRFGVVSVIAVAVLAVLAVVMGLRSDLGEHPAVWLATLAMAATVAVVALPAIGAGVWFPSLRLRWILTAVCAVGLGLVALAGPGATMPDVAAPPWSGCAMAAMIGAIVVSVGVVAGRAFVQRRSAAAVWWTATGIGLGSGTFVTTLCGSPVTSHVLSAHLGPAILALLLGAMLGRVLHRRAWNHDAT
jgi:hypothetical protein